SKSGHKVARLDVGQSVKKQTRPDFACVAGCELIARGPGLLKRFHCCHNYSLNWYSSDAVCFYRPQGGRGFLVRRGSLFLCEFAVIAVSQIPIPTTHQPFKKVRQMPLTENQGLRSFLFGIRKPRVPNAHCFWIDTELHKALAG